MTNSNLTNHAVLITEEQLKARITELGNQISRDFAGQTVFCVGVLEDGFVFMADLVRALSAEVLCQFVRSASRDVVDGKTTEIFFSPEPDVKGQHVLLIEPIFTTGLTTDFLTRNFLSRGAASVRICALLDRKTDRHLAIEPDYIGFQVGDKWLAGYGLGTPHANRNLPFIFEADHLRRA